MEIRKILSNFFRRSFGFPEVKPRGPNENISVTQTHQFESEDFNDFYGNGTQIFLRI